MKTVCSMIILLGLLVSFAALSGCLEPSTHWSCHDGVDNNGNGWPDLLDPVCWVDM